MAGRPEGHRPRRGPDRRDRHVLDPRPGVPDSGELPQRPHRHRRHRHRRDARHAADHRRSVRPLRGVDHRPLRRRHGHGRRGAPDGPRHRRRHRRRLPRRCGERLPRHGRRRQCADHDARHAVGAQRSRQASSPTDYRSASRTSRRSAPPDRSGVPVPVLIFLACRRAVRVRRALHDVRPLGVRDRLEPHRSSPRGHPDEAHDLACSSSSRDWPVRSPA